MFAPESTFGADSQTVFVNPCAQAAHAQHYAVRILKISSTGSHTIFFFFFLDTRKYLWNAVVGIGSAAPVAAVGGFT